MDHPRYRWTAAMLDVPFLMGAVGATALTGPALVTLLRGLGRGESGARNLLTRMVDFGVLEVERAGRTNIYRLSGSSGDHFREVEGTAPAPVWEGWFQALLYAVPESSRTLRDRVLHTASVAGYGLLRPGILIGVGDRTGRLNLHGPDVDGESWLEIGTLTPASLAQAQRMAGRAWRLPELADAYVRARRRCEAVSADVPVGWRGLVLWRDVYACGLQAQLADPHLPRELLPASWPEPGFVAARAEMNRVVGSVVQPFLYEQLDGTDPDALTRYRPGRWNPRP